MCNNNDNNVTSNNNCECLAEILNLIVRLQRREEPHKDMEGCEKPFLGPCPSFNCFNTRPVNFYTCCNSTLWTLPYTLNGMEGTSSVFRVENVDDCCCTCRVLANNPDTTQTDTPYVATDSFFTIKLTCVGALKCLRDTYVACV